MARLTPEQWQKARADFESDPKASYDSIGKKYGVSKAGVGKRALAEGWVKRVPTPEINDRANRRADASVDPAGERERIEVDGKVDASSTIKKAGHEAATDEMSIDKRTQVIVKHREEVLRLDAMAAAARSMFVGAINAPAADRKDAWWRAKIAADTVRDHVAVSKMKQDLERKAWGMDVVSDHRDLETLSDEDLQAIVKGRSPRGRR